MLRYLDAGESHGKGIACIIEGMPGGLPLTASYIEDELGRRRLGYGRGARMGLEQDRVEVISGIRAGRTLGSPITLLVLNAEFDGWREVMAVEGEVRVEAVTAPRPGHADLAGALKYGTRDIRDILERASARETVGRVCAGSVAKRLLEELGVEVYSHVLEVGGVGVGPSTDFPSIEDLREADSDDMRCLDAEASREMRREVDKARESGDSLGGLFQVVVHGLPAGLGSHVHWDRRLDARLAAAVMGIQAVKGVEIGDGFELARMRGSRAADEILYDPGRGFYRSSNHGGGIEGGMSNGELLLIRAAMKPIPTLANPLRSVDIVTREVVGAAVERADVCAVAAAAVIAESCVAFVLADAIMEKTGGDSLEEIATRYQAMVERQSRF
ncbi:MAG: chorismate synthase [Actinomycetota bacterium]